MLLVRGVGPRVTGNVHNLPISTGKKRGSVNTGRVGGGGAAA